MTLFYPVYVRRSDGKSKIGFGSRAVQNVPDPKLLDQTPDSQGVCDYFRHLDAKDPKHVDWRRKLAGMLMREVGASEDKSMSNRHGDIRTTLTTF